MRSKEWKKIYNTIKLSFISILKTANEIVENIRKIKNVQVLVLLAKNDPTPVIKIDKVVHNIKSNNLNWIIKVIQDCGHMMPLEKSEEVLEEVYSFLRDH